MFMTSREIQIPESFSSDLFNSPIIIFCLIPDQYIHNIHFLESTSSFWYGPNEYKRQVEIQPGKLTFVNFVVKP